MLNNNHDTPAAKLATGIARLANHPMVKATGQGEVLKTLVEYLGEQQRERVDLCQRVTLLEGQLKTLQGMGGAVDQFIEQIALPACPGCVACPHE